MKRRSALYLHESNGTRPQTQYMQGVLTTSRSYTMPPSSKVELHKLSEPGTHILNVS
jgi:hypothetical protein